MLLASSILIWRTDSVKNSGRLLREKGPAALQWNRIWPILNNKMYGENYQAPWAMASFSLNNSIISWFFRYLIEDMLHIIHFKSKQNVNKNTIKEYPIYITAITITSDRLYCLVITAFSWSQQGGQHAGTPAEPHTTRYWASIDGESRPHPSSKFRPIRILASSPDRS